MIFHNFDYYFLNKICYIFDLSSALACRVESINFSQQKFSISLAYRSKLERRVFLLHHENARVPVLNTWYTDTVSYEDAQSLFYQFQMGMNGGKLSEKVLKGVIYLSSFICKRVHAEIVRNIILRTAPVSF